MNLSRDLFAKYFNKDITQDELYESIGIGNAGFEQFLFDAIFQAYEKEDAEMLEYLIFTLYLGENVINLATYLDILNSLIVCVWHNQHEDIVLLLQKINSSKSIDYLFKAIYLKPDYLEWDDNYAFEKKCVHAMSRSRNEDALEKLKILASDENEIIRLCAKQQLQKINSF